jgi:hypothetical protein
LFDPRDEAHSGGSTSSGRRLALIQLILAGFVSGLLLPSGLGTYHRGGSNLLASVVLLVILGFAAGLPIGLLLVCFPRTRTIGVVVASVALVALVGVVIRLWLWNAL